MGSDMGVSKCVLDDTMNRVGERLGYLNEHQLLGSQRFSFCLDQLLWTPRMTELNTVKSCLKTHLLGLSYVGQASAD